MGEKESKTANVSSIFNCHILLKVIYRRINPKETKTLDILMMSTKIENVDLFKHDSQYENSLKNRNIYI